MDSELKLKPFISGKTFQTKSTQSRQRGKNQKKPRFLFYFCLYRAEGKTEPNFFQPIMAYPLKRAANRQP
jgi:hypothetical protein